ncbi:MAG TPA: hypothetical protein VGJ61_11655 [Solirubrobacterales bacterium]|jgi:hypothetical protein
MNDDRYVEYGAATGIVFVILSVIGFAVVIPTPPDLNAPAQEWSSYFLGHHDAVRAGLVILAAAMFFFIWFLGTLTSVLRIATGTPRLPSIVLIGGVLGATCLLIGFSAEAVAAYRPQGVDPVLTRALNDIFVLVGVAAIPAFTAFFAAAAVVILRTGAFPAWLGWLLVIGALVQPLTFGALFTKSGAFAGDGVLGLFIPFIVSLVAIFALSALITAWARDAARPGNVSLTDRIRGAVTGAATGAAAGARGERPG